MNRLDARSASAIIPKPRIGFLGMGWIGLQRMQAIERSGNAQIVAIADSEPFALERARRNARNALPVSTLDEVLEQDLDGIVISTPSAQHAEQAIAALDRGIAVFCQKPLGRTSTEARRIVSAAQRSDRLLGVDLCYRHTEGMHKIRELVRSSALHDVYAAQLTFHNAYGPDKAWVTDPRLSGGGALMDLGTHVVDLALWTLDFPGIAHVSSRLFAEGRPVTRKQKRAEDYVVADLTTDTGAVLRLSCSWRLHAGQDCVLEAAFFGTRGGARFHNLAGSFHDFGAELLSGTTRRVLSAPPDDWQGRAAVAWAEQLTRSVRFDPSAHRLVELARVIDRIYEPESEG